MLKTILNLNGVKEINKTKQLLILGGTTRKLICEGGSSVGGDGALPSCHCSGMRDGIYLVSFDDNGNYSTYNILGQCVDNGGY